MPPKRRRRFQGLYYHSSPPKVLPMNGHIANSTGRRRRDPDDFSIKLSTIRIWMHEKDIGKLTRVLWAGQGNRLRQQASTNPKVKRFLAAVPYVMNSIKDVHQAVIDNSLETLQSHLEPPVPPALVTCRDANGLNLIHKAAGLGHATILEYLITTWPDGVHETDITGKTPLHWAASAKNNMRCYTLLTQAGCDEEAVDYKMKTPSFYRHKPNEIERAFLTYVPEAPRVSPDVATDWEALSDDSGDGKKLDIKIPEMNGFGRHSNAESNENTSEAEMTEAGPDDEDLPKDGDVIENNQEPVEDANGQELEESSSKETDNQVEVKESEKNQEEEFDEPAENDEHTDEEKQEKAEQEEESKEENEEDTNETMELKNEDRSDKQQQQLQNENQKEIVENLTKDSHQDDAEKKSDSNEATEEIQNTEDKSSQKPETKESNEQSTEEPHENERITETETEIGNKADYEEEKDINDENVVAKSNEIDGNEFKEESVTIKEQQPGTKDKVEESQQITVNENKSEQEEKEYKTEEILPNGDTTAKTEALEGTEEHKSNEESSEETIIENKSEEDVKEERQEVEGKEINGEDEKAQEPEYKTVGEALDNIKEEVKDNVKYLANQIKNVFKDNKYETKEKGEEEQGINKDNNEMETSPTELENNNKTEEEDEKKETDEADEAELQDKDSKNEKNQDNEITQETETDQSESIKEKPEQPQTTSASNKPPSAKENSPKEIEKTEGDENNNSKNKEITTQVEVTDSELEELNKALENYQNAEKEDQEYIKPLTKIGDKIEEAADTFKENVLEMADKIKNVFTSDNNTDNLENDSQDVVVHSNVPKNVNGLKKLNKSMESSDETGDEDEESQNKTEISEENPQKIEIPNEDQIANEADVKEPEDNTDPKADTNEADLAVDNNNEQESLDDPERDGDGSPTSSLAIEGFVQGIAEDNTVQSKTAAIDHDDKESHIQSIIATGDMEQLAQIVLNGDGQKLLNVVATEPEIQAFLRNVPNYMNKIRRVHEAARGGSLLNLQQALDRRKFAVAKDEISPNGATPLHVAVLFGHSDIVRYLSARFPETMTITDKDGRTPLHYAAVISDNGHFYNVLLQLGANPKVVDKLGHTPEDYLSKEELKGTFKYSELLKSFGAEDLEQQLLSDQGQIESHSCQENPIFKTEQGKYLADNLADPLIKALTQVAQKRPNDPLQYLTNYLQNYVATRNKNGRTITQAAIHTGSGNTNSTARMNGHVRHDITADIDDEDAIRHHIEEFNEANDDDDDGNDSEAEMSKKLEERDEHGQSMLHFACARSHRKGGLIHLIEESKADITYRDELYRTARDIALQANQLGNAKEIDHYILSLAIVGDVKPFEHFAISGYDHIIDVLDDDDKPIIDVVESRGNTDLAQYLRSIRPLEELREELHQMIRDNKVERVTEIANGPSGNWLIKAKNYYGRTALHIAILKESVEIVEMFVNIAPEALKISDNLERTPLHYAMGTNIIENISHILIQNGAKRTYKDLKGRQPSYYFMNKADILRLQEEEDENR